MPELMTWADVVISGGGITCWELEYMAVPMLVIVWALNQEASARALQKKGLALTLGLEHAHDSAEITRLIRELLSNKQRRLAMSRMGRVNVDGQGVQRVLEFMKDKASVPASNNLVRGRQGLSVVFCGGKQAGCIGLLTIIANGYGIKGVVAYDSTVEALAKKLGLPTYSSIKQPEVERLLFDSDLLVSTHAREIIPRKLLALPHMGGVNVHPCLYRYKGANPVERLLQDGGTQASVGVHRMTEIIDEGEVLAEEFVDVTGRKSVGEIYNELYPLYATALLKALRILETSGVR
jgi:folate-dependent phosphoribosylglycinamide formyltransferase PurN